MLISRNNIDYIEVDENWLDKQSGIIDKKFHLVKLLFCNPTKEVLDKILKILPKTNRFIIEDNVKFYNGYFKQTNKKYYVENIGEENFITFLRKNNKILINFNRLSQDVQYFLFDVYIEDLLNNVEIIKVNQDLYEDFYWYFKNWNGNIIITS